ncbi:MAG: L-threonylcarbamoyladenylate synthase [Elusimicrobiota bacterium]
MKYLRFNKNKISGSVIETTVDFLKKDGVIIYPTETIYGLGGNATKKRVINRISKIKKRPLDKSYIILVKNFFMLKNLGLNLNPLAKKLAKSFWPGPLTMILSSSKTTPVTIRNTSSTVAVRISSSSFVNKLFERINFPLISTSSNLSGYNKNVNRSLCDLVLFCGQLKAKPSTVIDVRGKKPILLRKGSIPFWKIKNAAD